MPLEAGQEMRSLAYVDRIDDSVDYQRDARLRLQKAINYLPEVHGPLVVTLETTRNPDTRTDEKTLLISDDDGYVPKVRAVRNALDSPAESDEARRANEHFLARRHFISGSMIGAAVGPNVVYAASEIFGTGKYSVFDNIGNFLPIHPLLV